MLTVKRCLLSAAVAVSSFSMSAAVQAADVGTIEGQFVLDGAIPNLPLKVKKGDATAKDAAVCAVEDIRDEQLIVDPDTKGIANVIIYLKKAPAGMPANLKASATKEVEFDQKGCTYLPHVLSVRTDQTVKCISSDGAAHNVNITPFVNEGKNFIVPPGDKKGNPVNLKSAEALPVKVKCDIHPWMGAYWVIQDHPYVAITDSKGKFKIENLPVGEHSFTVWQESVGYVNRKWTVNVKAGAQTLPAEKVPADKVKIQ